MTTYRHPAGDARPEFEGRVLTSERPLDNRERRYLWRHNAALREFFNGEDAAMSKPNYAYSTYAGMLLITDNACAHQPAMSVTNAAERVIEEIREALGHIPPVVLYRDSEGRWDRMVCTPDGRFSHVEPIGAADRDSAIHHGRRILEEVTA